MDNSINANASQAREDNSDTFGEFADAVASMMSISRTIRVEFFEQRGICSGSGDGGGDGDADGESIALLQEGPKVNISLHVASYQTYERMCTPSYDYL